MNTITTQDQEALRARLRESRQRLDRLSRDLHGIDEELEGLATDRQRFQLLEQASDALSTLADLGAAELFWGSGAAGDGDARLAEVRARVEVFHRCLAEIEERRAAVIARIREEEEGAEFLEEDLFQAQQEEERRKLEWIVEREISALPAQQAVMPWSRGGEDDQRFRKSLAASLLVGLLLGLLLPLVDLPLPDPWEATDVPERLARLVREERPLPPPPATLDEPKPEEQKPEPEPEPELVDEPVEPTESPVLAETPAPKAVPKEEKRPESKGILAFREKFSELAANKPAARLGAEARISTSGEAVAGRPERSMVTTQAPGSSGGINLASLSRDIGGGGGGDQAIAGVQLTRATSSIGGSGGQDRPLAGGPGAGRTDEEIQIVFDRHKAALYRLYNRELRRNPTLQGQMVLRIRIEPDGSVTLCELQATDMDAPDLSAQVVDRVMTFDFGAKEVPAVTILYPIDFLPAV